VIIELDERMCMENHINSKILGRLTLSDESNTVAYGRILELID